MKPTTKKAFTIVELLTVISIITIIIGLLVPALNKARDIAYDTKQKAQFHAIDVALELFKTENDDYPDTLPLGSSDGFICGAHVLAEAMVGRDLKGYDPMSSWNPGTDENNKDIYASNDGGAKSKSSSDQEVDDSYDRRKGPYLKLENIGAFDLYMLYPNATVPSQKPYMGLDSKPPAPVLTDVYRNQKVTIGTKTIKTGSPILYYKADPSKRTIKSSENVIDRIYRNFDNDSIVNLKQMMNPTESHDMEAAGAGGESEKFYEVIENPQVPEMPYNSDSYILISAGKDGNYGTADDIYNFGN